MNNNAIFYAIIKIILLKILKKSTKNKNLEKFRILTNFNPSHAYSIEDEYMYGVTAEKFSLYDFFVIIIVLLVLLYTKWSWCLFLLYLNKNVNSSFRC